MMFHHITLISSPWSACLVALSILTSTCGFSIDSTEAEIAVFTGAGDIAGCSSTGDESTAALLDNITGTIFTLGDNAYRSGTAREFRRCYRTGWGRHKARTRPTVGNHEYTTPGAADYFSYFGAAAGDPSRGYYSFNLGDWHIIALNSMCDKVGGCDVTSPMVRWLRNDLANNVRKCTLAYFHHPLFSSGQNGNPKMRPSWDILYGHRVDVVLSGHDHIYERFAPQKPDGTLDQNRGVVEFVVGTGGVSHHDILSIKPNSIVRNDETFGVLKLVLRPLNYSWRFIPVLGQTFTDAGTRACH